MTNAELIRAIRNEIERLKTVQLKRIQEGDLVDAEPYDKNEAYNELLDFLDTLESEKPSEGLEEEFNHYCFDFKDPDTGEDIHKNQISFNVEDALNVARHFAEWGAEHTPLPEDTVLFNKGVAEGRRLEREENLDRDNVYWKGIQYAKEQMLKDGLDAVKTLDFNKAEKTIAGVFVKYGMDPQKEQMMNDGNVILAEEDFDAEKEKLMEWGYNLCKEQMMKEAVEADVNIYRDLAGGGSWAEFVVEMPTNNLGDKVRIIIVKED